MNKLLPIILIALIATGCFKQESCEPKLITSPKPIPVLHGIKPHVPDKNTDGEVIVIQENQDEHTLYDIQYDNAPLDAIIQEMTKVGGYNIIVSSGDLTGTVTANLKGVELMPALESIIGLHNFRLDEYYIGSGVYKLVEDYDWNTQPIYTEMLFYKTKEEATQTAEAIEKIWGGSNSVKAVSIPARKAVILKANKSALNEIKRILNSQEE